jgi:hypothetical protein
MDETKLNEIINAWIIAEEAERGSPEHESNWWAIEQVMDWTYERQGEDLWQFITTAYKRGLSDKAFGALAAGPLEDLLAQQGPEFIERIEELARKDPEFNELLGGVWQNTMDDEIWRRVQAARLNTW